MHCLLVGTPVDECVGVLIDMIEGVDQLCCMKITIQDMKRLGEKAQCPEIKQDTIAVMEIYLLFPIIAKE